MSHPPVDLKPQTLLRAYGLGHFPMADSDGVIRWYRADPRGIIPLDPQEFHIPHTLKATINQRRFQIRINTAFEDTMRACAQLRAEGTWINEELVSAYTRLHELGFAHSVEAWQNNQLVGGLYGVSLGGAFFGESMFHRVTDASKVALVHLVGHLHQRGFQLLDTQASTSHLRRFGCREIPAAEYSRLLQQAIRISCRFAP